MESSYLIEKLIKQYLPHGARIASSNEYRQGESVELRDMDGGLELTVLYFFRGEYYELILNQENGKWHKLFNIRYIERSKLYVASKRDIYGVKWGYINSEGKVIIKPQYKDARDFQYNGLAVVCLENMCGIINSFGEYVVEPKYENINDFHEGLAVVYGKKGVGIINEKGEELKVNKYDFISNFKNGRAVVIKNSQNGYSLYGYIDKNGTEVIPLKYKMAEDFNENRAVVKVDEGKYKIIDLNGKVINSFNYDFVGKFSDGLLVFKQKESNKYGFIDEKGNVVIYPKFAFAEAFENGRAVVNLSENYDNKYGLIDKTGKFIIEAKHNDIRQLKEGMVAVGDVIDNQNPYIGSKYAIYDINGNKFTDFIYYGVSDYENHIASAYDNNETFFINKRGERVEYLPKVKGSGNLKLDGDIIKADIDKRIFYLTLYGKVIWEQNKDIRLNDKYSVMDKKYRPNLNYLVYYPEIQGMSNKSSEDKVNNNLKELSQIIPINSEKQLEYNYFGDFDIKFFKNILLVLGFYGYRYNFGLAHGMPSEIYAHINLENGKFYKLNDLFKKDSNYVMILSEIIKEQIKQDKNSSIWIDEYKGIKEDQPFYLTSENLNIYFYPYEIAPYAAGFPTFKIPYKEIMSIINTEGEFWKSFN